MAPRVRRMTTGGPEPSPARTSRPPGSLTVRSPTFTSRASTLPNMPAAPAIALGLRRLVGGGVGRLAVLVLAVVGQAFDGNHVLVRALAEDGDALGVASGDADLGHWRADQL